MASIGHLNLFLLEAVISQVNFGILIRITAWSSYNIHIYYTRFRAIRENIASYPGPSHPDGKWAWYPLFAHARNLPEILVHRELSCYIRALITSCSVMSLLTVSCHEFIMRRQRL